MRGHLWFIFHFGFLQWLRYERARRAGIKVEYPPEFAGWLADNDPSLGSSVT